jgi:Allene oxide cyclase
VQLLASALATMSVMLANTAGAETIKLVEHAITDDVIHIHGTADSLGDLLVFSNPVFDSTDRVQRGHDQGYCIRVVIGKSWECFWTLFLKGGQITVEGPFYDKEDSVLAVTGGVAEFAGVRGSLRLHARNARGSEYDFTYDLLDRSGT